MALSQASGPALIDLAYGQVREVSFTIDSDVDLTGNLIRVVPALFDDPSSVLPFIPSDNYFELTYPGVAGTTAMTWVGALKYQNLVLELERVTNLQFILHYDFIVGVDRSGYAQQVDPLILLTNEGSQFSIYNQSRRLKLFIFDSVSPGSFAAETPATGEYINLLGVDSFQTVFRRPSGVQVGNPVIGENLTVDFSLMGNGLSLDYDVIIFNEGFCATQGGVNDSIETHLDLEGATSSGPAALPSLTTANLTPSAMVLTSGIYRGSFEINSAWLIGGCTQSAIIVVTEGSGNKKSYKLSFIALEENIPDPDVVVSGSIEGDGTIYTTGCFANIAPCQRAIFYSSMDTTDYDTKLSALGLPGNYNDNIQAINVYVLNHKPVDGEDLSLFESTPANTIPLTAGNAFFPYTFPADALGVTFIVFDYVFKDHSLRVPIKVLHPVVGPFDNIYFEDEAGNPLNPLCYDYSNGLRLFFEVTVPANEYGLAPNVFKIYLNDVEQDIIIPGTINSTESLVDFEVDVEKVIPGECYKLVASRDPLDSALIGVCPNGTFNLTQQNISAGRFRIIITKTDANVYFNPRSSLIVSKNGEVIHRAEFISANWAAPEETFFNFPYANDNTFKYEFFIYPENGCNFYDMAVLTTNDQIADSDTAALTVTA